MPLPLNHSLRCHGRALFVVNELKDKRARDHLDWLQSEAGGCQVEVREPGPEAMVAVVAFAKQTGDYSVLSRPDLSVLALTYALEVQKHGTWRIRDQVGGKTGQQKHTMSQQAAKKESGESSGSRRKSGQLERGEGKKGVVQEARPEIPTSIGDDALTAPENPVEEQASSQVESQVEALDLNQCEDLPIAHIQARPDSIVDDSEDDEETGGEWITSENITKHKNRALGLITDEDLPPSTAPTPRSTGRWQTDVTAADDGWSTVVAKKVGNSNQARQEGNAKKGQAAKAQGKVAVACMTGDYAVQNVLLQMGLSLVGIQGQQIKQVKSWVLRCHACSKICKDSDKKFCPQCGNPTLLRTSVTSTAPDSSSKGGGLKVHLKKNFQYKNRGTIYSLPLPKQGKAGGARQSVPILREDQAEWQKALNAERVKRGKEERALQKALERGSDSLSARYEDADELSMLLAGGNAKNRTMSTGLPSLGVGRKNPNDRRRRKV